MLVQLPHRGFALAFEHDFFFVAEPEEARSFLDSDRDVAADGEVYQRRGDVAQVDALVDDGADAAWRDARRRLVTHHDRRTSVGIASGASIATQQERERREGRQHDPIVGDETPETRRTTGELHVPARPRRDDGQSFERPELAPDLVMQVARRFVFDSGTVLTTSDRAGVGDCDQRVLRQRRRQMHRRGSRIDGRPPLVSGRVPVEFVVIGKLPQSAADAVAHHVGDAALHLAVRAADANVHVLPHLAHLSRVEAALPVADADELELQRPRVAGRIGVVDRDLTIETVSRLREIHFDGFRDQQIGVRLDGELGMEGGDREAGQVRPRQPGRERGDRDQNRDGDRPTRAVHARVPKSTRGTAASARSSSSKKSRSLKPIKRERITSGNDWMRVLRSRTTAL